jgi:hypothetical protein
LHVVGKVEHLRYAPKSKELLDGLHTGLLDRMLTLPPITEPSTWQWRSIGE